MRSIIRNTGNSKGVILPRNLLKECRIEKEVIIEVKDNTIIISPAKDTKRKGWAEAFKKMAENGDDKLLIPDVFEEDDLSEWTWK
jgi:antitoxin MazE